MDLYTILYKVTANLFELMIYYTIINLRTFTYGRNDLTN